jgi:tetratricopeptide (TPR) repeat protein
MAFVGRARALSRLHGVAEEAVGGRTRLVLVAGEAGIGKTTLVGEFAARSSLRLGWGTCADAERTPAFWPWTVALRGLISAMPQTDAADLTRPDTDELARLLPELSPTPAAGSGAGHLDPADAKAARLQFFDAVARFLERMARNAPTLIVLDDLQWADESTLALLDFVVRPYRPVPLVLIGAYRHDELGAVPARALGELAAYGEPIQLSGLSPDESYALVAEVVGVPAAERWASEVHRRTDGHPFFARQVAEVLADPTQPASAVPAAVSELVARRVARLSVGCRALVEAAAVAGNQLQPDVLGEVCGIDTSAVAVLIEEGVHAGVLVRDSDGPRTWLAHDLYRESISAGLALPRRLVLHQRIADALEHRQARGAVVVVAEMARHCAAAVPLGGIDRAVAWARSAAQVERAKLAFDHAASHLARARGALEDLGDPNTGSRLVDLLIEEADARARAGDSTRARVLLDDAWNRASALGDAERLGRVALGKQRLGARFAMPRDAVIQVLQTAQTALRGTGTALEAQLTASLARELHHSIPGQRSSARPLSEEALGLARRLDDPETLAACLLARHDILWTPDGAEERIDVAREIVTHAERIGDAERQAEGLLLTATALLEQGSAAFRTALTDYLRAAERFGQPRHDYMALTRRAALAMIDGQLGEAERLIAESSQLGARIGEPDTGNVRISQLLGLVRARREPTQLRATAAEAIRWWVGVPSHAHAVAAGLFALAGEPNDLDAARRALDTVIALDTWRQDRSYLWSVFVGAMATAAVRLDDQALGGELLAELTPLTDSCGVNGAVVCFMGSNAHWAGILARALDRLDDAQIWLEQALATHQRLGARVWEAETRLELAALEPVGNAAGPADAELRRDGELWLVRHRDSSAHFGDLKGLTDLAALLARPGTPIHVLDLAGAGHQDRHAGTLLDATARATYRRRLAELDEDLDLAREDHDIGRVEQVEEERAALLAELSKAAGLAGRARPLGASTTERARKAVTARLR